jgi:hypothetical protein
MPITSLGDLLQLARRVVSPPPPKLMPIRSIIEGRGQDFLNTMTTEDVHALMSRLEEETYRRLGIFVGKLED